MRGPAPQPPLRAASPAARRSRRRPVRSPAGRLSPPPAEPPCPRRAGRRPPPGPRTSTSPPATPSGPRPPRPPRCGPGSPGRSGPGPGSFAVLALLAAFLGELGEERHELVRRLGTHPRDAGDVLTLEIEDVVEHAVPGVLQDGGELGRQALELAERHLRGHLLLGRERREERALAATLQPL